MTSSRSYRISFRQGTRELGSARFSLHDEAHTHAIERHAATDRPVTLHLEGPQRRAALRVRLGEEVAAVLPPSRARTECDLRDLLRDQFGEALFEVRLEPAEAGEPEAVLLTVLLPLRPPNEVVRLYLKLVADLEEAHVGLARDILSRTVHRSDARQAHIFEPSLELRRLEEHLEAMRRALALIGDQPSTVLTRTRALVRWRAGDPIDAPSLGALIRSPEVRWRKRRPVQVGRIRIPKPRLTVDLPEHRHLRAGLLRMVHRTRGLREGCRRAADLLEREEHRWGIGGTQGPSVYEERFLPRRRKLTGIAEEAAKLEREFRSLLDRHDFLREAGTPRTRLGATPLFLRRRGYREGYDTLVRARREQGPAVDGQEFAIHLRSLDTLYEYWTYVTVVRICWKILGAADEGTGFRVIHDFYRPELRPGQFFEWRPRRGCRIRVYYEPDIPPLGRREAGPFGWQASLVGAPLRPDVLVAVEDADGGRRALVLDAKNTTRFPRERLFRYSDYRTLVHDPETGRQPVRQAFFVHRDPNGAHCSFPAYLDGGADPPEDAFIVGSIALLPDACEDLVLLLETFLSSAALRPASLHG